MWNGFGFKWYHVPILAFFWLIANLVALPHWIMGRPYWYARFIDKTVGQEFVMWDIYKE